MNFNPNRLRLARQRRRLTGRALADAAKLSSDTISRLEKGQHVPDAATVRALAAALGFPVEFFEKDDPYEITPEIVSFRSFSKMSAKLRDSALSAGSLGLDLNEWFSRRFQLPELDLLEFNTQTDPAVAAAQLRQHWGLGERPIGNLIGLIENYGVRVFSLSEETATVNAFSFWMDSTPYIFSNNFKSPESSIFDAAHELGHIVLHRHGALDGGKKIEKEADTFASAFLMPEDDVRSRMPRPITVDVIIRAKQRWRVSTMAMAYRCHKLNLMSDWQYKSACIELGRRGYRTSEPDGIQRERSLVWSSALKDLWKERITKDDIASDLGVPFDQVNDLVWGLT